MNNGEDSPRDGAVRANHLGRVIATELRNEKWLIEAYLIIEKKPKYKRSSPSFAIFSALIISSILPQSMEVVLPSNPTFV
jgi:hypothetical protein